MARDVLQAIASAYPHFDHAGLPALLDGLGLTEHAHKPVYMLSTGSRRKLWLAGALSAHATLTLVDEPFAALDRPAIAFIVQRLHAMAGMLRERRHAWVLADYEAHPDLRFDGLVDLGD